PRLLVLVVEPVVFSVLVWTNDVHHTVWRSSNVAVFEGYYVFDGTPGLAFWGHQVYAYGLIVIGAALLVKVLWRTNDIFRDQSTALLVAITVPMIVNALYIFAYTPGETDPTGIAFVLSGAVLAGAILYEHLLEVAPATRELGREKLIGELDDPVVIVDAEQRVVDLNPAGESLLGVSTDDAVGTTLTAIEPTLAAVDDTNEITLERDGRRCYYDVRVSRLDRARGTITGRIISLRDVTERTRREQRLDVMNRLYRHNLRNEMNVVRGNAELLVARLEASEHREYAETIIDTAEEVITRSEKISALSRAVEDDPTRPVDLSSILRSLVESFRTEYPEATIALDAPETCRVVGDPSIEIAIQELIENALEHADRPGPTVRIDLTTTGDDAYLEIRDDGPGIPEQELRVLAAGTETPMEHASGVGLWLVTWAVERVGGSAAFETDEGGTTATVTFLLARDQ
ncbi:MAG: histidine kinase N-terminal 7TM domain-containing protein, partial [Halapricum sp.]